MSQSKLNYQEIIDKLQELNIPIEDFAFNEVDQNILSGFYIAFDEIHQQGGEGEGDHWESVKYFPEQDIYIKVIGFYQSYNGTEFYGGYKDCCSEVRPKEKTITVYE